MIFQTRDVPMFVPPELTQPCQPPFDTAPQTYGEAYQRDPVWKVAFDQCNGRLDGVRRWVEKKQAEE